MLNSDALMTYKHIGIPFMLLSTPNPHKTVLPDNSMTLADDTVMPCRHECLSVPKRACCEGKVWCPFRSHEVHAELPSTIRFEPAYDIDKKTA